MSARRKLGRKRVSCAGSGRVELLVFLAACALLVCGMAPALYLRDSGELTTAAWNLGVAHETGFPLFLMAAKALSLLPLGEVATRVNLLSVLSLSVSAALAFRLALRLSQPAAAVAPSGSTNSVGAAAEAGATSVALPSAVGAAAMFVAGYTVWKAGTVAEVYAPTVLSICVALVLAERLLHHARSGARLDEARVGLSLWLVAGLAMGLHASFRLLLVIPFALVTLWRLRAGRRWPLYAPLAFAVGALVVFYLPVAASRGRAADWGDARTLGGLVDHLSAARIRRAFADQILTRDPRRLLGNLQGFVGLVEGQLGLPALLLAAVGMGWLLSVRERRGMGLLLGCMLCGDVLYSGWINPMGVDDLQCGVPTALALSLCAGVGVAAIARRLLSPVAEREVRFGRTAAPIFAGALAAIAVLPAALATDPHFALGQEAHALVRAALLPSPSRALVLTESDDLSAGTLYEQVVAGLRPDVTVIVRQEVWDARYLARAVRRGGGAVLPAEALSDWAAQTERSRIRTQDDMLRRLLDRNLDRRAVLWEPGDDHPPAGTPLPGVPLFALERSPEPPPAARPLVDRLLAILGQPRDPIALRLLAGMVTRLGSGYFVLGDEARAGSLFRAALGLWPEDAAAATNLAVVEAKKGDLLGALALDENVLEREPDRLRTRLNAGRLHLAMGDLDAAEADFRRAAPLAPASPAPLVGLARVQHARGDDAAARRLVERALSRAPDDREAQELSRTLGIR